MTSKKNRLSYSFLMTCNIFVILKVYPVLAAADKYTSDGCYVMNWATNFQPNVDSYRATLVSALNQYNADQSDANWEIVRTAFVDGWAAEYNAVNN